MISTCRSVDCLVFFQLLLISSIPMIGACNKDDIKEKCGKKKKRRRHTADRRTVGVSTLVLFCP